MPETFILVGDALSRLRDLDDNTFNVAVTSPPYYGLRDYGGSSGWTGGDVADCPHVRNAHSKIPQGLQGRVAYEEAVREAERLGATPPPPVHNRYPTAGRPIGNGRFQCSLCGAIKTDLQVGLEESYTDYIDRMVKICGEVKRVLRPDGTFFLNIGDSYSDKSLLMVPSRLAMALQDIGWYLRSEIIWSKTSAMPESITDRPTNAHEKIFMLTKTTSYYFDGYYSVQDHGVDGNIRSVWTLGPEQVPNWHFATYPTEIPRRAILLGLGRAGVCATCGKPWRCSQGKIWLATCPCGGIKPVGGMVLDPFLGSGTTALVANSLGHDCVGIELNPDNATQARQRIIENGRLTNSVTLDGNQHDQIAGR